MNSKAQLAELERIHQRDIAARLPGLHRTLLALTHDGPGRLRRVLVAQDLPRPDDTLAALAAAAGGR